MILRKGMQGDEVRVLQEMLNDFGAKLIADGVFGVQTELAVIDFQKKKAVTPDGVAGPKTFAAMGFPSDGPISDVGDASEEKKLFDTMAIRSGWLAKAETAVNKIRRGRERYEAIARPVNLPWYFVGCLHLMESGCDFTKHLHNGDPLTARTKLVPKGRPKTGNPPFTWEESAKDALEYDGLRGPMDTIGEQFKAFEKFNGTGYRKKGINTPYIWSGTTHYSKGKYVKDGVFDAEAVSEQVGIACVYKILQASGELV